MNQSKTHLRWCLFDPKFSPFPSQKRENSCAILLHRCRLSFRYPGCLWYVITVSMSFFIIRSVTIIMPLSETCWACDFCSVLPLNSLFVFLFLIFPFFFWLRIQQVYLLNWINTDNSLIRESHTQTKLKWKKRFFHLPLISWLRKRFQLQASVFGCSSMEDDFAGLIIRFDWGDDLTLMNYDDFTWTEFSTLILKIGKKILAFFVLEYPTVWGMNTILILKVFVFGFTFKYPLLSMLFSSSGSSNI